MDELAMLSSIATDVKEGASAFKKGLEDNRSALDKIVADFREAYPAPNKTEPEKTADVEEVQVLSGVTGTKVFGLPIGQALIGGASAVAVGELVDMLAGRFMPAGATWMSAISKAVAAWLASSKWVTNVIGKPAGTAAAILLTYDAIRDIIPFDTWITDAIPGHRAGEFGSRGMTGNTNEAITGGAVLQATKVARNYYSNALGGG